MSFAEDEEEFPWLAYNYGETPPEVVKERFGADGYPMVLNRDDYEIFARMVNQGIDSHLEAMTGYTMEDEITRFTTKKKVVITDAQTMLVFLRRLLEESSQDALNLRGSILTTLNIEEI